MPNSFTASLIISFVLGMCLLTYACRPASKKNTNSSQPAAEHVNDKESGSSDPSVIEESVADGSDKNQQPTDHTAQSDTRAYWADKPLSISCNGRQMMLAEPISRIAKNIENDSLDYNVEPFSDCSGIFHRVLDSLKKRCPTYAYPTKIYRSSRDIGKWYFEQGAFIRIKNPLEMSVYIKPGAVMLYGGRSISTDSLETEALFAPGGINHVGVVVSVKKDEKGIVTAYSLFHGQRPGKRASVTRYHKRTYRNRPNYPPYGNGTEHWVGIAPIVSQSQ